MSNQLNYYWKTMPLAGLSNSVPTRESIIDTHETLINKFYDEFFGNRKNFLNTNSSYPKMDITEDSDNLYIKCAVPGVTEDDLNVETNKETKVLTISGQTSEEHKLLLGTYAHIRELKHSKFTRSVKLPEYVDVEDCDASLKDGILSLKFKSNKQEITKQDIKKISIKKS
jgi:HSP20 family protein